MTTTNTVAAADDDLAFEGCLGDLLACELAEHDVHPGEILASGVAFYPVGRNAAYSSVTVRGNGDDPWAVTFTSTAKRSKMPVRTVHVDGTAALAALLRSAGVTY